MSLAIEIAQGRLPLANIPVLPADLAELADLALDMRWTWSHGADALWRQVNAETWDRTRNPWIILQDVSQPRLEALAADAGFVAELRRLAGQRRDELAAPGWFATTPDASKLRGIAYFSMEFGVGEALPLYAGGLGVLAGDILKTASDLAVPIFGIGLLYQEGYFRQIIDASGWQHEAYPYNEPAMLPVQPVRGQDGGWLRIPLSLPGRTLLLRVWKATVGRTVLYLLDSNDPLNSPVDRGVTAKLYESGSEMRLMQDIVLGVAAGGSSRHCIRTRRCATSTRATPPSRSSSGRACSAAGPGLASGRRSGRRAAEMSSRPIRRSMRPSTASTPP